MALERAIHVVNAAIATIAGRQHGVITYAQLLQAGLSPSSVRDRVRSGRLFRVHRGVYAVGHPALSIEGRWMAAVLACGDGAVLSHRSAAELWGMLKPLGGLPSVSVPRSGGRRRRGIVTHRPASLLASDATVRLEIPVTTPTPILVDLRRTASSDEFRRAFR